MTAALPSSVMWITRFTARRYTFPLVETGLHEKDNHA